MENLDQLRWTVLPLTEGQQHLQRLRISVPPSEARLGEWIALLHPAMQPDDVLAWREVGEPLMREALQADNGSGSATRMAEALLESRVERWRVAHIWTAFSRWHPNDCDDWYRWIEPCPAPDDDALSALLAPTSGWLLWDFQFMSALLTTDLAWDTADGLRREWNLRRPGIAGRIANRRINGVPLEQALLQRTLPPGHLTTRLDAWPVQRLARWAAGRTRRGGTAQSGAELVDFTLTHAEQRRYFEWAGASVAGHHDADAEFPGVEFVYTVAPFGEGLEARIGSSILELR